MAPSQRYRVLTGLFGRPLCKAVKRAHLARQRKIDIAQGSCQLVEVEVLQRQATAKDNLVAFESIGRVNQVGTVVFEKLSANLILTIAVARQRSNIDTNDHNGVAHHDANRRSIDTTRNNESIVMTIKHAVETKQKCLYVFYVAGHAGTVMRFLPQVTPARAKARR